MIFSGQLSGEKLDQSTVNNKQSLISVTFLSHERLTHQSVLRYKTQNRKHASVINLTTLLAQHRQNYTVFVETNERKCNLFTIDNEKILAV